MLLNLKARIGNKLQSLDLVNKWKSLSLVKKIICIAAIVIAIAIAIKIGLFNLFFGILVLLCASLPLLWLVALFKPSLARSNTRMQATKRILPSFVLVFAATAISSTFLPQDKYHNLKQTPTIINENGGFIDNGNGTITDKRTGLMWDGCLVGENWNNNECAGKAKVYSIAEAVESIDHSFEFADYDDWRIPTKGELESLSNTVAGTTKKGIWTMSPDTKDNSNVIAVFYYGRGTTDDNSGVISLVRNAR